MGCLKCTINQTNDVIDTTSLNTAHMFVKTHGDRTNVCSVVTYLQQQSNDPLVSGQVCCCVTAPVSDADVTARVLH